MENCVPLGFSRLARQNFLIFFHLENLSPTLEQIAIIYYPQINLPDIPTLDKLLAGFIMHLKWCRMSWICWHTFRGIKRSCGAHLQNVEGVGNGDHHVRCNYFGSSFHVWGKFDAFDSLAKLTRSTCRGLHNAAFMLQEIYCKENS